MKENLKLILNQLEEALNEVENNFDVEDGELVYDYLTFAKHLTEELIKKPILPDSLTAEDGYKNLLRGEFYEEVEVPNINMETLELDEETPTIKQKVPIQWTTIKEMYKTIVEFNKEENEVKEN